MRVLPGGTRMCGHCIVVFVSVVDCVVGVSACLYVSLEWRLHWCYLGFSTL